MTADLRAAKPKGSRPELAARISQLERRLSESQERAEKLEDLIRWALGYTVSRIPPFTPRGPNDPPYWWRKTINTEARRLGVLLDRKF